MECEHEKISPYLQAPMYYSVYYINKNQPFNRAMSDFFFVRVLLHSSLSINSSTCLMSNVTNLSAMFSGNFTTYKRKTTEKQRMRGNFLCKLAND